MRDHRDRFFLATKTNERTYEKARDQFAHSLERMQVASVDLLQLHNLVDPEEWETALGPGGALQAAVEAREQGLTRFIGVTGHGVTVAEMHLRSLERDSDAMPDSHQRAVDRAADIATARAWLVACFLLDRLGTDLDDAADFQRRFLTFRAHIKTSSENPP
jgi:aryl-alcohol dehydrogenase-like predicted oxidoreductase